MKFTKEQYGWLRETVFSGEHTGYRPSVQEAPNGDGKVDVTKRYAHVAAKYRHVDRAMDWALAGHFYRAHAEALRVARVLGVPELFYPSPLYSALRVLEYPVGAGSELHTDFDLFTLLLYRNDAEHGQTGEDSPLVFLADEGEQENSKTWRRLQRASAGMHIGEIGELVGMGSATRHAVLPSSYVQHSIVYFAIPDHAAVLPDGRTVGEWLSERVARSRVYT